MDNHFHDFGAELLYWCGGEACAWLADLPGAIANAQRTSFSAQSARSAFSIVQYRGVSSIDDTVQISTVQTVHLSHRLTGSHPCRTTGHLRRVADPQETEPVQGF